MARRKTKIKKEVSNMEENNIETVEEVNEEITEVQETIEEPEETIIEEAESEIGIGETEEVQENVEEPIVEDKKFGTVLPNKLNVRENPEKSANILEVLNRNDKVEILEELELFYKIKINDTIGYCVKEFIV